MEAESDAESDTEHRLTAGPSTATPNIKVMFAQVSPKLLPSCLLVSFVAGQGAVVAAMGPRCLETYGAVLPKFPVKGPWRSTWLKMSLFLET